MASPTIKTKKRLIVMLFAVSFAIFALIARLGYIQIVQGEELKKEALEQWARDITINAKRGIIYDRKGKKLAVSVNTDTVVCTPADVKEPKRTANILSEILDMDKDEVYKKITKRVNYIILKRWIDKDKSEKLREADLNGIKIIDDTKRYYPFGNFASYILGFTDVDQVGLYGVERTYNKYLTGVPGRLVMTTDAVGRQLPYGYEKFYEPEDGVSLVLTLDETIQHFAEKAALEALVKNKAKKVSIIIMEPNTGEILAMAQKPDFDPNEPRVPLDGEKKEEWNNLPITEKQKKWYDMWRNFAVNDSYEPGSTFKIITAAAGLEENIVTPESEFYCNGYITDIPGAKLKCWRYYNPHGHETFVEGVQNSCNVVFVTVGRRLGAETMYRYIKAFGFGEKTGIDLTGEQSGLVRRPDNMKEVELATISYGQGISVTPIQLVTAISAVANGGKLMQPMIVKKLVDVEGKVVHKFEPEVKKRVISEETSETLLKILETVVSEGTGKNAYVPGYRVGGKTGTAQKVIDGRYASGKYIASFVAIAPVNDPKITALVVIDEPSNGAYYGGVIAAPVAGQVIEETLKYLDVERQFTEKEISESKEIMVTVPDVTNKTISEASRTLISAGLDHNTEIPNVSRKAIVIDQFPLPNTKVKKGSMITLYVQSKRKENNKVVVPSLTGKSMDEVTKLLNELNLDYKFKGNGKVINQNPKPGAEVDYNSVIEVEFGSRKQ
ncbi:stage V sporulation protein D [Caldisalinibacter kiritimatiensis]|uniref:Cell division protein FtsI n=1 Tax=Caldisalinibacter kiritimatiensis TaxID=1304284 RepID=R1CRF0_9FIRM|nr:stage V sporulation protein D [Caldisalinibacter kiritimatiensis]EOD01256.1 Cell division protein FtsI [Caldisalinibacter kiritimatiensis]